MRPTVAWALHITGPDDRRAEGTGVSMLLLTVMAVAHAAPVAGPDPIDPELAAAIRAWDRYHTPAVEVWTNGGDVFDAGDEVRVFFRAETDGYVTVLRVDTDGRIQFLHPGTPWRQTFVRAGEEREARPGSHRYGFQVDDYPGRGYLFAVLSDAPFTFNGLTKGEEWDYREVFEDGRIVGDPYAALGQLAARFVDPNAATVEYDILPYEVGERHAYPRFLCYDCHARAAFTEWNPYRHQCSHVRIVIHNDPTYYPARVARANRVVFTRPRTLTPRYILAERDPRHPYIEEVRGQPRQIRDPFPDTLDGAPMVQRRTLRGTSGEFRAVYWQRRVVVPTPRRRRIP